MSAPSGSRDPLLSEYDALRRDEPADDHRAASSGRIPVARTEPSPLLFRGVTQVMAIRLFVTLALAGFATQLLADPQAPAGQDPAVPTFRSAAEAIQVSAIVTDADGAVVSGLTKDDFELLEDGKPQTITTFSAIDIPVGTAPRTRGETDVRDNEGPTGRVYLIVLDDMSPEYALRTRHFLRQFIETHFGPNDVAAVVLTTRGPRESGQDFTSSRDLLLSALDRFSGGSIEGDREKNFMGSLRDLVEVVAKFPVGRKAVLLMSSNIPGDAYMVVDRGPGPLGGLFDQVHPDFRRAVSLATRSNVAFYPIDPAGLTDTFGALEERMNLTALADVTGGFSLANSNNYEAAFERLVRENSTYYVLGFNSSYEARDGRRVPLQIRVKRPGLQVNAIDGYLAPSNRPTERRAAPGVFAAVWDAVASPLTTSGVPMRVFAAGYRGRDKDATVAVVLEISASRLNLVERDGAHRGDLDVVFAVTDAKNKKRPLIRHRAAIALKPATYERVRSGAIRLVSQLALPEGRYQIRVSAGGESVAGSVVYDLHVPDFRDDFSMSGISITSEQARETITVSPPYPRLQVPLPWAPTTAREFVSDDTLALYGEVYENRRRPHTVTVAFELRDAGGRRVSREVTERPVTARPSAVSVHRFSPTIRLQQLMPGAYTLLVEASSSLDGNRSERREIPILVR
jgi:VWFA-related protein